MILIEPEEYPEQRISQFSVSILAEKLLTVLGHLEDKKKDLEGKGLQFNARTLLLGPPGTDLEAFVYHIAREHPLKVVRVRISQALGNIANLSETIRIACEFAKRNSPAILFLERIDIFAQSNSVQGAVLQSEINEISWDENEVLVIASTTRPDLVDREVLSSFSRIHVFEGTTFDDRVRAFEKCLEGRDDFEPTQLAELTEGWSFSDIIHLSTNLLVQIPEVKEKFSRERFENFIKESGSLATGRQEVIDSISRRTRGVHLPLFDTTDSEYPSEFLDQLYIMAVGDDFQGTQRVIESLNSSLPLSVQDKEFLGKYPFLLSGSSEDRLTRLMRAKRSSDRLSRIMGR